MRCEPGKGTYRVKSCEVSDLLFATQKLGIELRDDLVGQHCCRPGSTLEARDAGG
jgi:hypothetical protein